MKARQDPGPLERLVLTSEDQRAADEAAYARGVRAEDLMESAGRSAADWILDRLSPSRVAVLVGPGGNGGDGLVVARRLAESSVEVQTFLFQSDDRLGEAPQAMLERLHDGGWRTVLVEDGAYSDVEDAFESADWVVDGLLGSGVTRPLVGRYRDVVERLNASDAKVISLDLPSGLSSDEGVLVDEAVRADVTLAMEFLKPAHLLHPASAHCGNVAVVSVAYPPEVLASVKPRARVPEQAGIQGRLPLRRADGHKGTFGRVLVVAGSIGMTGAAILCCRAALRAGAGLVTLA
ncbi:MAG: NAD(P)H-hydrate epimerase, partial [Candidatus Bipolaricaulia bacterium]